MTQISNPGPYPFTGTKICPTCSKREGREVRLPVICFASHKYTHDKLNFECRECVSKRNSTRYAEQRRKRNLSYRPAPTPEEKYLIQISGTKPHLSLRQVAKLTPCYNE